MIVSINLNDLRMLISRSLQTRSVPQFCCQDLVPCSIMKDLRISPCFVELPVPANLLSAVHGGPMRASARFPKHRSREAKASATWTATGAVLAGLAVRCARRSTRSIRTLHATGITALDVATDIPTEVDGDSCTPPWKGDGAFEIPDEVVEHAGGLDYVVNFESKKVRGCLKGAKQVATLGPASAHDEMLERLFLCGVDTFRLNFSHGDHSEKTELIARIRRLEAKYRHPIGILADMQGPKPLAQKNVQGLKRYRLKRYTRYDSVWLLQSVLLLLWYIMIYYNYIYI